MMISRRHFDSGGSQPLNQPRSEKHRGACNENSHVAQDIRKVIEEFATVNGCGTISYRSHSVVKCETVECIDKHKTAEYVIYHRLK